MADVCDAAHHQAQAEATSFVALLAEWLRVTFHLALNRAETRGVR